MNTTRKNLIPKPYLPPMRKKAQTIAAKLYQQIKSAPGHHLETDQIKMMSKYRSYKYIIENYPECDGVVMGPALADIKNLPGKADYIYVLAGGELLFVDRVRQISTPIVIDPNKSAALNKILIASGGAVKLSNQHMQELEQITGHIVPTERVEVWRHDANSLQVPILEDQALKRATSIIMAAKKIIEDEKRPHQNGAGRQLNEVWTAFKNEIQLLYSDKLLAAAELNELKSKVAKANEQKYQALKQLIEKARSAKKPDIRDQYLAEADILNKENIELENMAIQESVAAKFEKQRAIIKKNINELLNDVAYIWGRTSVNPHVLMAADYQAFYQALWHAVEEVIPPHKRSHILVFNEDPIVMSVQYYERGVVASTQKNEKQYISAHKRDGAGIANFIAYSTGSLDLSDASEPCLMTDLGFRHASLVPIDFYKQEKRQKLDLHAECVNVTTQNFTALYTEIQSRLFAETTPKTVAEKKEIEPVVHLINVSLLTVKVDDNEQKKQFQDTILAADRLRSRKNSTFKPITFDFGVQVDATGSKLRYYPDEQKFENHRAFFQLHTLLIEQFAQLQESMPRILHNPLWQSLQKKTHFFTTAIERRPEIYFENGIELTERGVLPFAERYDRACTAYFDKPTLDNKALMQLAEQRLNAEKISLYQAADGLLTLYKTDYPAVKKLFQEQLTTLKQHLQGSQSNLHFVEAQQTLLFALVDFTRILDLYLNDTWHTLDENFKLPATLIDFGSCLGKLDASFPNEKTPRCTTTSWNCKSNNDRSSTLAAHVDIIRAEHLGQKLFYKDSRNQPHYVSSHYVNSAWVQSPILDTDGGGPKFGGKIVGNLVKDSGHPFATYAELQISTSKWATHKLAEKSKSLAVPTKLKLGKTTEVHHSLIASIAKSKLLTKKPCAANLKVQTGLVEFFFDDLERSISAQNYERFDAEFFKIKIIHVYLELIAHEKLIVDSGLKQIAMDALIALIQVVQPMIEEAPVLEAKELSYQDWYNKTNKRGFCKKDSDATKKVMFAFQAYQLRKDKSEFKRDDQATLFNEISALKEIQYAVLEWLAKKHGGSQFQKVKNGEKHQPRPSLTQLSMTIRSDSRLEDMLDLKKFVEYALNLKIAAIKSTPEIRAILESAQPSINILSMSS